MNSNNNSNDSNVNNGSGFIKVGRGHDAQVRVTDISVSRFHALFRKATSTDGGFFVLEDNGSKFGTLVLVRRPVALKKKAVNYFQLGRTLIEFYIKETSNCCNIWSLCSMTKANKLSGSLIGSLRGGQHDDYFPKEFLPKLLPDFTQEDDGVNLLINKQHQSII